MLNGLAFLLLAMLLLLAIGYQLLLANAQQLELLDRRIAARVGGTAPNVASATISAHRPVQVPDIIAPLLVRAQLTPTPRMLLTGAGALAILVIGALLIGGAVAGLVAATLPPIVLIAWVQNRARAHSEALVEALPFFLDAVRQLLTIGHSLPQALTRALPNAPAAIATYMGPAIRRIELGVPVVASLEQLATRLQIAELSMLVAAIRVNQRFGGPMAQVLGNLSSIVRERWRIKREIRSATSEVRVSTYLLVAMPILLSGFFLLTSRAYLDFFVGSAGGRQLAMIAAGMQLTGTLIMVRLMRLIF
jgi:tight adherence protein B